MITGLYTLLIPMVLYAVFGSSRHLVVGADSATAAILALDAVLAGRAAPKKQRASAGCSIKWRPGNEPDYF